VFICPSDRSCGSRPCGAIRWHRRSGVDHGRRRGDRPPQTVLTSDRRRSPYLAARLAHATSNSWAARNTPRRRNAAGACTTASTRAAFELNGNQKRRSDRVSLHDGPARPSRAARCSANAAKKTSQRSSPVSAGSASRSTSREPEASQRYSFRNSATSRHRKDSSADVSKSANRIKVIGWYGLTGARSSTPTTVVRVIPITRTLPCEPHIGPADDAPSARVSGLAGNPGYARCGVGSPDRPIQRSGVVRGNPVGIRGCPAAVSGNDRRQMHWTRRVWEATATRSSPGNR
jgi:hypothetical protein